MKRNILQRAVGVSLATAFLLSFEPSVLAGPKQPKAKSILSKFFKQKSKKAGKHGRILPEASSDADFYENGNPDPAKVRLGNLLFFDKILSGNMNISCATCHHPFAGTSDGLSLPIGEGAFGISVSRNTGHDAQAVHERVPRNAPAIFNAGAREFTRMFHDGRVEVDPSQPSGFRSPAGDALPAGLDNVLAVQAMFPVTSGPEMAGQAGENAIGDASAVGDLAGPDGVWAQLAERLRDIPGYVDLFIEVYPHVQTAADISYVDAANAMAAFEAVQWRADNSPFDRFLRGDISAMSLEAARGMELFYGEAGCASCHSGTFQTDHDFHAIAIPQIGPGKGDGAGGREDFGRERVTQLEEDRYRFRTPSLRNVALTGPWGHDGAYNSLEAIVRHHVAPAAALESFDVGQLILPSRDDLDALDLVAHGNPAMRAAIAAVCELEDTVSSDQVIKELVAFLHALTDPASLDLRRDVPVRLPSELPVLD